MLKFNTGGHEEQETVIELTMHPLVSDESNCWNESPGYCGSSSKSAYYNVKFW